MREFFHGWRRKFGVVTLVMACAATATWLRSRYYEDDIRIRTGQYTVHVFHSFEDGLGWIRMWEPSDAPRVIRKNGNYTVISLMDEKRNIEWQTDTRTDSSSEVCEQVQWQWNVGGCRFGGQPTDHNSGIGTVVFQVPYTLMMVPLTLLSAYLLLWPGKRVTRQAAATHQQGTDDA